jgi:hypothetical protein
MMRTHVIIVLLMVILANSRASSSCDICIVSATCADDAVQFNVTVSKECVWPLIASFSYQTDISSHKYDVNKTILCHDCWVDLSIDMVHDAWDYNLRLEEPESAMICSKTFQARCGGLASRIVWIVTICVSALFVSFGILVCTIRFCQYRRQLKQQEVDHADKIIN